MKTFLSIFSGIK